MSSFFLPNAIYIATGSELISGEKREENTQFIAKKLKSFGILVSEIRLIADEMSSISAAIKEARNSYDYVFISGGIGINYGDVTALAVANAFEVGMTLNQKIYNRLKLKYPDSFKKSKDPIEGRMAYVPDNSEIIELAGVDVPGFFLENVFVLPGNPKIFQKMIDEVGLIIKSSGGVMSSQTITLGGIPESNLISIVSYVKARYKKVFISTYAFVSHGIKGTKIVIKSQSKQQLQEAMDYLYGATESGSRFGRGGKV